jgi:alkylation response protein AidB-like acyl-CoA dehydrogenase
MDIFFGPEQVVLRARVEKFCAAHCSAAEEALRDREPTFPTEMHRAMATSGILGHCLPRSLGGADGGPIDLCVINETLGRHSGSATNILFVNGICGALIARFGTDDQKERHVRGIAEGTTRFAFALTEPGAGSDAQAITSHAVRDGDHYVVEGTKLFTTGAAEADFILTVVRTSQEGVASKTTSLLIIPTRSKGLTISRLDKIATNDVPSCRVEYRGVRVGTSERVGPENQGWSVLMSGGSLERLSVAATCVGLAQAAFDEARAHALEREQYGQPIAKFQAIQHQLADMATEIEAMRLLTYSAAWKMEQGTTPLKEISMAKLYCSERCADIVMRGMRLLGGKAYLRESSMQRRLRESILPLYAGGTVEIQRNLIARALGLA